MRLINTTNLQLEEFVGPDIPPYTILSHTWGDEEVLFQEMGNGPRTNKEGFRKIRDFCTESKDQGYDYGWVDTCCIDKSSSAELSEALNSMYLWYKEAEICYTYLSDVPTPKDIEDRSWLKLFANSRWFTRGWTLQELIAPKYLVFYSENWERIGSKKALREHISKITGIDRGTLKSGDIEKPCVAEIMSWASQRVTTRPEDAAYCLLGLFGVQMTLLYGERKQAFVRLQRQIAADIYDPTLFAWESSGSEEDDDQSAHRAIGLFALSPANFVNSSKYRMPIDFFGPYSMHNTGLEIRLPLIKDNHYPGRYTAVLDCAPSESRKGERIGIRLQAGSGMFKKTGIGFTKRLGARISGKAVDESVGRFFMRVGSVHPFFVGVQEQKHAVFETIHILGTMWDPQVREFLSED